MDQEGTSAELPLELRCEAIAPWLWRVAWAAGGAVASDAEREQIAQVAASRANGALVVLAPAGTNDPLIPAALTPIVGTIHRGFSSPDLTRHERTGEPGVFFAPRGRGRVVMAARNPTEAATRRLVESLATKEATAAALERIELMLAADPPTTTPSVCTLARHAGPCLIVPNPLMPKAFPLEVDA
jgi:hypothetical protein